MGAGTKNGDLVAILSLPGDTGVATEAVAAMSAWGLAELGLPEILGIVDVDNAASRRVLEKAGYARSGDSTNGRRQLVLVYRRAA